jgi:hypothetical protein
MTIRIINGGMTFYPSNTNADSFDDICLPLSFLFLLPRLLAYLYIRFITILIATITLIWNKPRMFWCYDVMMLLMLLMLQMCHPVRQKRWLSKITIWPPRWKMRGAAFEQIGVWRRASMWMFKNYFSRQPGFLSLFLFCFIHPHLFCILTVMLRSTLRTAGLAARAVPKR